MRAIKMALADLAQTVIFGSMVVLILYYSEQRNISLNPISLWQAGSYFVQRTVNHLAPPEEGVPLPLPTEPATTN